jgi:hypothetical protein
MPTRPQGTRSDPQPNQNFRSDVPILITTNHSIEAGFNIFPTLFALDFSWEDICVALNNDTNQANIDIDQEALSFALNFGFYILVGLVVFGSEISF